MQVPIPFTKDGIDATEKTALSDAYIARGVKVIEEQVLVGGLRLANVIKAIYGSSNEDVTAEEEEEFFDAITDEVQEDNEFVWTSEEVENQAFLQW